MSVRLSLAHVLNCWDKTPYLLGAGVRRIGTDCIGFVCGVLSELRGERDRPEFRICAENLKASDLKRLLKHYPCKQATDIEPGDVILVALSESVSHVILAGPSGGFWEAIPNMGVVRTGADSKLVRAVYRPLGKGDWSC